MHHLACAQAPSLLYFQRVGDSIRLSVSAQPLRAPSLCKTLELIVVDVAKVRKRSRSQ